MRIFDITTGKHTESSLTKEQYNAQHERRIKKSMKAMAKQDTLKGKIN